MEEQRNIIKVQHKKLKFNSIIRDMTTQEFIFDCPLHTSVKISETTILTDLCKCIHVDGYNPFRDADTTYYLKSPINSAYLARTEDEIRLLCFECQRYRDELYLLVHVNEEVDSIEKVGQYPSVASIHISQVKQYRKVLGESYIRDFTKAIGLAASGIGTGSFVYLRRVFEHLITEIATEAIRNGEIDKIQFESSKMENKLKMLSNHLPEVVLENKPLYGVLSAGIHELSENDCLKYFAVVRQVIELILDEQEHIRLKEEKKRKASNELGRIAGEVRKTTK